MSRTMAEGTDYVGAVMGRMGTLCDDCLNRARQKAKDDHTTLQDQFQHARKRLRGANGETLRLPLGALNENEVHGDEGESKRKPTPKVPEDASETAASLSDTRAANVHHSDENIEKSPSLREAQAITRDFTFKDLQRELKSRGIKAAGKKKELKERLEKALAEELASEQQVERTIADDNPVAETTGEPEKSEETTECDVAKTESSAQVPVPKEPTAHFVQGTDEKPKPSTIGHSPKKAGPSSSATASVEPPPKPPSPPPVEPPKTAKTEEPPPREEEVKQPKKGLFGWMRGTVTVASLPAVLPPMEEAAPTLRTVDEETAVTKNKVKDLIAEHEASKREEPKKQQTEANVPPPSRINSNKAEEKEKEAPPSSPRQIKQTTTPTPKPIVDRADRTRQWNARVERDRLEEVRARQERERELKRKQQLAKERAQQERLFAEKKRKEAEEALRKAAAVKRHEEAEARRKLREDEELRRIRELAHGNARPHATPKPTPGPEEKPDVDPVGPHLPEFIVVQGDENIHGSPKFKSPENPDEERASQQSRLTPGFEPVVIREEVPVHILRQMMRDGHIPPRPIAPAPPKPPSPPKPPPPQSDSYEISDREDTTDDEDDDGDSRSNTRHVPMWACGSSLREALRRQADKDPSQVFNVSNSSCDLEKIFKHDKPFKKRTSSQNWSQDLSTYNERQKYRVEMGFTPPKSS